MQALFDDLASRPTPWYSYLNIYDFAKNNETARKRFSHNWEVVFGTGFGLSNKQREYIRLKYINGLSYEEISERENFDVSKSKIKELVESHLDVLMSPRAYCLFDNEYPMKPSQMKNLYSIGFFNNYGQWVEPKHSCNHDYLNIALFDLFDSGNIRMLCKRHDIHSIGDLCNWITENKDTIENHKAGVGRVIAGYFIENEFIIHNCKDEIEILTEIAGK